MKKIYIYMIACLLIGVLMLFRQSIRQLFSEDLTAPTSVDKAWQQPPPKVFERRILLELHYFNPRLPSNMMAEKIAELKQKNFGIHTILSGSPKIRTNAYMRALAQEDWGIEEIRLHSTTAINIYAFLNLIRSSRSLKRVLIWNNTWDKEALKKITQIVGEDGLRLME
jgi:hypothetical protein